MPAAPRGARDAIAETHPTGVQWLDATCDLLTIAADGERLRTLSRIKIATQVLAARARLGLTPNRVHGDPLVIVFSRDRAAQLELFLRTYSRSLSEPLPLTVIYSASSPAHEHAYRSVTRQYAHLGVSAVRESSFRTSLLAVVRESRAENVIFFVDDIVFIRPIDAQFLRTWNPRGGAILSLRLGANITHAFNEGYAEISQPTLRRIRCRNVELLTWKWKGAGGWGLPTSVDGHVFRRAEILPVIASDGFRAPNSLEREMGRLRFVFRMRPGYCFEEPKIVNLPLNSVKTEAFEFPHGDIAADLLLDAFTSGLRLDISELSIADQNSCHMPWVPRLVPVGEVS